MMHNCNYQTTASFNHYNSENVVLSIRFVRATNCYGLNNNIDKILLRV